MTAKECKIEEIEERVSDKGRKYWRVKTEERWYSCFEKEIAEEIKENVGKRITIEIVERDNGFINITGVKKNGNIASKVGEVKLIHKEFLDNIDNKNKATTMYTSYAKDIFIALISKLEFKDETKGANIMEASINLVKQAKKEFS